MKKIIVLLALVMLVIGCASAVSFYKPGMTYAQFKSDSYDCGTFSKENIRNQYGDQSLAPLFLESGEYRRCMEEKFGYTVTNVPKPQKQVNKTQSWAPSIPIDLSKLKVGMASEDVQKILGKPQSSSTAYLGEETFPVLYYPNNTGYRVPIFFKNNFLVGWGDDFVKKHNKERKNN